MLERAASEGLIERERERECASLASVVPKHSHPRAVYCVFPTCYAVVGRCSLVYFLPLGIAIFCVQQLSVRVEARCVVVRVVVAAGEWPLAGSPFVAWSVESRHLSAPHSLLP